MELKIERIGADKFRIEGEIRIEFSVVEEFLQVMESLKNQLSEYRSLMKEIYQSPQMKRPGGPKKRFLSVHETAEYLGISPQTIYNKARRGSLYPFPVKPKRIGRRVLFDYDDLKTYLKSL